MDTWTVLSTPRTYQSIIFMLLEGQMRKGAYNGLKNCLSGTEKLFFFFFYNEATWRKLGN